MKIRVYYHDTDCGGVVYYANYLKYMEEARTEFFEQKGISIKELAQNGILFVVARQEVNYQAPAFYADTLNVEAVISEITKVKIIFEQKVTNQNGLFICAGKTFMVCVDKNIKPQLIDRELKERLSGPNG